MALLNISGLTKEYGKHIIVKNAQMEIQEGQKIGLVGQNGTGKTTLLNMIMKKIEADEGTISISNQSKIGYLKQEKELHNDYTIWEEMNSAFDNIAKLEKIMQELIHEMSDTAVINDEKRYHEVTDKYDKVSREFETLGGYDIETKIKTILSGFMFESDTYQTKVSTLSGGQRTRLLLAKTLLQDNDLLILDEPTNHLDIKTVTWLESYLKNYPGALLIVSHDRYFLDKIVDVIYEIESAKLNRYVGDYTHYVKEKVLFAEKADDEFDKQQKFIKKTEEFIAKNIAHPATTTMAKSRRKMLEKMDVIVKPRNQVKMRPFEILTTKESGKNVLLFEDASIGYNGESLLKNVSLEIYKNDRVAIMGENGIGKSTLLKAIFDESILNSGEIKLGASVDVSYYTQDFDNLTPTKDVISELWDDFVQLDQNAIRATLGRFLFSQDDVNKKVSQLSGGQKARLSLAKIYLQKPNFLIMDEPTNHLDLHTKEILEETLTNFEGTILFISHDRYFINKIANKVFVITPDHSKLLDGNYEQYIKTLSEERDVDSKNAKNFKKQIANPDKELKRITKKIEDIEKKISTFTETLNDKTKTYNDELKIQVEQKIEKQKQDLQKWNSKLNDLNEQIK